MNRRRFFPLTAVLFGTLLSGCGWETADMPVDLIPERIKTEAEEKTPDFQSPDAETERLTECIIGTDEVSDTEFPEITEPTEETEPSVTSEPPAETETAAESESALPPVISPETTMTLDFVGDVLLAAENGYDGFWSFNQFAYETEPSYYFSAMRDLFSSDDFTIANCENVFSDRALDPVEKEGEFTYWYRSGTANAEIYPAGSIEIVSLANNHTLDYGPEGRDDTLAALREAGMTVVPEGHSVTLTKGNLRVGLLCISMYSEYQLTPITDWLAAASETTDYQIVYYHGGTERTFLPDEWRVRASHTMVDAGADLVIGNHPHFLQPAETYRGKRILYSLGDFLFGGAHTEQNGNRTAVYRLELTYADGVITEEQGALIPCYCYGELWQPAPILDETQKQKVLDFLSGKAEMPY